MVKTLIINGGTTLFFPSKRELRRYQENMKALSDYAIQRRSTAACRMLQEDNERETNANVIIDSILQIRKAPEPRRIAGIPKMLLENTTNDNETKRLMSICKKRSEENERKQQKQNAIFRKKLMTKDGSGK